MCFFSLWWTSCVSFLASASVFFFFFWWSKCFPLFPFSWFDPSLCFFYLGAKLVEAFSFLSCKCKPCVFYVCLIMIWKLSPLVFFSSISKPPLAFLISSCEQVVWSSYVASLTCKCKPCAFVFFCLWSKHPPPPLHPPISFFFY